MCVPCFLTLSFIIYAIIGMIAGSMFYIIKIIKQHNKLKEANKIEENKRKKELVDNVLKELKLR